MNIERGKVGTATGTALEIESKGSQTLIVSDKMALTYQNDILSLEVITPYAPGTSSALLPIQLRCLANDD